MVSWIKKVSNRKSSVSGCCLAFAWLFAIFRLVLLLKVLLIKKKKPCNKFCEVTWTCFFYVITIVSLRVTTPLLYLSSTSDLSNPPFLNIFLTTLLKLKPSHPPPVKVFLQHSLSKPNLFNGILLLIQLKSKRKIADFRYFDTVMCLLYTFFLLNKLLMK